MKRKATPVLATGRQHLPVQRGPLLLMLAVVTISVAIVALPAWGSSAANVQCHSGDILEGTYNNVSVAKGNFCLLLGATVLGNVMANNSEQIGIDGSNIGGDVQANNVTDNGWLCGSTVGGNVEVGNAGQSSAPPGSWFIGDASWCNFLPFDAVPGNSIGGNLNFHNDASGGFISNNDIEHNLDCHNNALAPSGSNNAVDGTSSDQCAGMDGAPDSDTLSPADSD